MRDLRIRTGGQTGVDRAALDACLERGVGYAGWCPRGGWAEDHPEPPGLLDRYPALAPTPSDDPRQRTAWNVRDSHASLILQPDGSASAGRTRSRGDDSHSPGSDFARACAELIYLRPLLAADPARPEAVEAVAAWVRARAADAGEAGLVLGIGGPRESEAPGIYRSARVWIAALLERLAEGE